jgi:hypothetical protein
VPGRGAAIRLHHLALDLPLLRCHPPRYLSTVFHSSPLWRRVRSAYIPGCGVPGALSLGGGGQIAPTQNQAGLGSKGGVLPAERLGVNVS